MVKGSIGDRILECIGYPESWTEQEIEDNKRVIQEEFSKIDSQKKDTIMDIKEYSTDIWDIIVDHFAETKYQMMCIRWCARGLALGDAIKKVQVDMEVAEKCLANKKRNM